MKKFLFFLVSFGLYGAVNAQYYYLDVVATKMTNQQYRLLRANAYRQISAISYDGDEPEKDFLLEQKISADGQKITTHSETSGSAESYFISYYHSNRIGKTVDSSTHAINTISYIYDNKGNVTTITSESRDFDGTFANTETHFWSYDDQNMPVQMIKVKNGTDTTFVTFSRDSSNNISEEKQVKYRRNIETYYYYYNLQKKLTDVVRYNRKVKALIPDYMFEYDNSGRLVQQTQTQAGTGDYLTWKYTYNTEGLKEKETVFNKRRELLGHIQYLYK